MSINSNTALAPVEDEITATSPLLSSVVEALSTDSIPFTGERFVFGSGVEIFYEHFHRYVFASRFIMPTQTVLDLGCGVGYGSLLMASKAKKVIALDVDRDSIALLAGLAAKVGAQNVQAMQGDVLDVVALIQEPVDVVVCHELIEHLPRHAQEKLAELIVSGKGPFHSGTTLLISTPETVEYNRRSQTRNEFHEHEFTEADFADFLGRYFPHVQMLWQGGVSGNIIVSDTAAEGAITASFVQWQNPNKLHGVVEERPHATGGYMYAIAGHNPQTPVPSSLLVDQSERIVLEKLTIAAKELNQKNAVINQLRGQLSREQHTVVFEQLSHDKIKALLRNCEELGARIFNAEREHAVMKSELHGKLAECSSQAHSIQSLQAALESALAQLDEASRTARSLTEAPLEVKFAIKCMLSLPNFIRRIIRRLLAIGTAVLGG